MKSSLNFAGILLLCFFQANAATNSWFYDTNGPRFQYDRFRKACFDLQGNTGRNPGYVGECGDLRQADLSNKSFKGANFNGADLRGAQLQKSDFTNADFRAADLRFSNWENTLFSQALINSETQLPFDANYASKLSIQIIRYEDLDRQLNDLTLNWLKSPGNPIPSSVLYDISLDADYLYNYGNLIHQSLRSCSLSFVDYLIKNRNFQINGTYPYFRPYLDSAMVGCQDPKLSLNQVQYLLSQGADPNLVLESDPPLWTAVSYGYYDIADALIKAGAKVDIERNGTNLIGLAASSRRAFMLPLLAGAGLDVNRCKSQGKPCSALEIAISKNDKDAVQYLLSVKADASVSFERPSLLDYYDDLASLDLLIRAGAQIKSASIHNRQNAKIIEYLVQQGASIDSRDANGETLLYKSMKSQNLQLVELALKLKANINAKTNDGLTAFSWTFKDEPIRKVWFQKFLDLGADPNVPMALNGQYLNQFRIVTSVDAVLSDAFERRYLYFMPMARAGLKLNEIQKQQSATNAIRYILQIATDYAFQPPLTEMKELQKLGADFLIPITDFSIIRPSLEISADSYSYLVRNVESVNGSVSLAFRLAEYPGFLDLYTSLGYSVSGPQNSRGDSLIFNRPYLQKLEHFANKGIPLDSLNKEGQNLYFYNSEDEVWKLLKSKNVPLITEDKEGNSLLAFLPDDLCSAKLIDRIKEAIATGANPHLVNKTYNLSLAQLILSKIDSDADLDCAKALLSGFKIDPRDFNSQWNMKLSDGRIIPGYGTLRLMLSAGRNNFARDIEINELAQTKYLDLIKLIVSLGYKPELENSFVSPQYTMDYNLLEYAYGYHFMGLVRYLKSRGIQDHIYKYEDSHQYTPPATACEVFPKSKAHKPFDQGCLSTQTGLIWSISQKVTGAYNRSLHLSYCNSLRGEWQIPSLEFLMKEHFTKAAKPGQFAYESYLKDGRFFDLLNGKVKERKEEKQEFYYLCVKPAFYWQN